MYPARYRQLSLAGIDVDSLSVGELRSLVRDTLDAGIHGISFSPYVGDQEPGTMISETQIRERLNVVRPHVQWIRTFSCTEGHEQIPAIAKAADLKTIVGIWLDDDIANNEAEVAGAIALAESGSADVLAVGNEVLLRGDLDEADLLGYINRVKQAVPGIPVGYVDAYFMFVDHPRVAEACDVILANCYPFWEGCPAEHALLYMKEMYRRVERVADGRKIIVSETGWPNRGTATGGAIPSDRNAMKFFLDTRKWAEEDKIDVIYFSAFDENWKVSREGDVGAFWGLWDRDGKPKYCDNVSD